MRLLALLLPILLPLASAQFNFFEQMFSGDGTGGHDHHPHNHDHHHQQQRGNPSDASYYHKSYLGCTFPLYFAVQGLVVAHALTAPTRARSRMRPLPLPRHPRLRSLPAPLPLRLGRKRGQV